MSPKNDGNFNPTIFSTIKNLILDKGGNWVKVNPTLTHFDGLHSDFW